MSKILRRRVRKVPATTNNLTKAIINFLILRGHYAFRVNNGAVYDPVRGVFRKRSKSDPAISDVIAILKPSGRMLTIEVKNAETGDKATSRQVAFAEEIRRRGGLAYFARRFDEFRAWLESVEDK